MNTKLFTFIIPKRITDIIGSAVFIFCFSPIYIVTAFLIWQHDKGNPIYKQIRVGKNGKHFNAYKFRSMVINADEIMRNNPDLYNQLRSGTNKIIDDPRVTKVGKFIRKYSIDEFAQMFNVLLGDMSIIGPRPLRPDEYELACNVSPEQMQKLQTIITAKPGITGLWQVSGRSNIPFDKRLDLEVTYANSQSLLMDLQIAIKTPLAILKGEGAY